MLNSQLFWVMHRTSWGADHTGGGYCGANRMVFGLRLKHVGLGPAHVCHWIRRVRCFGLFFLYIYILLSSQIRAKTPAFRFFLGRGLLWVPPHLEVNEASKSLRFPTRTAADHQHRHHHHHHRNIHFQTQTRHCVFSAPVAYYTT